VRANSTVSIVKCSDYERAKVDVAIREAIDLLGGIERYVRPDDQVLLKFNLLVGAAPEKAITTHPAVVRAMIGQVRQAGAIPLVGDCSGFEGPPNPDRYFNGSLAGPPTLLFPLMFGLTFLAAMGNELFYRGFLFTRMRQHTHWLVALLAAAAMFGFYHYFNSGLSGAIMGMVVSLVSGWLMQRHNNIITPILFHYLQYQAAILVFYLSVL
jgi:membrane protease YdiL (CAAX protease family)